MHIKVGSDLAYQMRFGLTSSGHQTAGSPPTSHQTQLGEIYSGQKKKNAGKININLATHPGLNIVTRNEEREQQQRGYFKSLQLSDVWESTMNWAACQTASFTKQIETFDRTCLPFRGLLMRGQRQTSHIQRLADFLI